MARLEFAEQTIGSLTFQCGGCDAVADVDVKAAVTYEHIGAGITKRTARVPKIKDLEPDGWMVCDPYTAATYCPTCWASIVVAS